MSELPLQGPTTPTERVRAAPMESLPDRGVLLTPDQRVPVFISSTLGERHLTQGAAMNSDEAVTCALEQLDTAETTSLGPVRGT